MSEAFNPRSGPILVEAEVAGPLGKAGARLILDTGATTSSLNRTLLRSVGYDPDAPTATVRVATGSLVTTVPVLALNRLSALGKHAIGLRVLAHDLPLEAAVDGQLGLDFLRDQVLTIDFRAGRLGLA